MDYKNLIKKAFEARNFSYSPYSNFMVGAALITRQGRIYTGCNIENAAYSPSNCAERSAFFKAVSEGERDFAAIAIVGAEKGAILPFETAPPCGVCRQVISEFVDENSFEIVLARDYEDYDIYKLKELLPLGFKL